MLNGSILICKNVITKNGGGEGEGDQGKIGEIREIRESQGESKEIRDIWEFWGNVRKTGEIQGK